MAFAAGSVKLVIANEFREDEQGGDWAQATRATAGIVGERP